MKAAPVNFHVSFSIILCKDQPTKMHLLKLLYSITSSSPSGNLTEEVLQNLIHTGLGKPSKKKEKQSMEFSILGWLAWFLAGHIPEDEKNSK